MPNVDYQQPYVRILRVNGNPPTDPQTVDRTVDNVFIISVNPASDSVTWAVYRISDAQQIVAPTSVTPAAAVRTFTIPANTLPAAGQEYLLRVAKTSSTADPNVNAELTLQT